MSLTLSIDDIYRIVTRSREVDTQVFLENFSSWFDTLLSPIELLSTRSASNFERASTADLIAKASVLALTQILPTATNYGGICKDLTSGKIQHLIRTLIQCPPWFAEYSLLGVGTCFVYFPGVSVHATSKNIIMYLRRFFETSNARVRKRAAFCAIAYVRAATPAGQISAVWNFQLITVLSAIHDAITRLMEITSAHRTNIDLFSSLADRKLTYQIDERLARFLSSLDSSKNVNADGEIDVEFLENRLNLLFDILRASFGGGKSGTIINVSINFQYFIDVLECLTYYAEITNPIKPILASTFREIMKIVSEELLPLAGISAAPFAVNIFNCCLRILRSHRENLEITGTIFELVSSVYDNIGGACLQIYQQIATKFLDFAETFLDFSKFSQSTATSTAPVTENSSSENKKSAKKRKTRLVEEMFGDRFVAKPTDFDGRRTVFAGCCTASKSLLESAGCNLKTVDYRRLQQTICRSILHIQTRNEKIPNLCDDPKCRKHLYELLTASILCPHPFCAPALQCAVRLFHEALRKDRDENVIHVCRKGLSICEAMAKPRVPYLETVLTEDLDIQDEIAVSKKRHLSADHEEGIMEKSVEEKRAAAWENRGPVSKIATEPIVVNISENSRENTPLQDEEIVITYEKTEKGSSGENVGENVGIDETEVNEEGMDEMLTDFVDGPSINVTV